MSKKTQINLERQILACKKRLKELSYDIESDEGKAVEYNKIIVKKAILLDSYKKLCFKVSTKERLKRTLRNFLRKPFERKEKLICDYFH